MRKKTGGGYHIRPTLVAGAEFEASDLRVMSLIRGIKQVKLMATKTRFLRALGGFAGIRVLPVLSCFEVSC
jgi:hypothetical protein